MRGTAQLLVLAGMVSFTMQGYAEIGQRWVARFAGPPNNESAGAIALDEDGYVYVTGNVCSGDDCHMETIKYDPCGGELWRRSWQGRYDTTQEPVHTGIAIDGTGIYVRGMVSAGSTWDYGVVKYDRCTGAQLWESSYPKGFDDYPVSIAVGCGGVYVTGYSSNGSDWDFLTVKFDASTGDPSGAIVYNGIANDYGWDVVVDDTGVYVTGSSYRVATGLDYCTIKYDCNLQAPTWVRLWDSPSIVNTYDFAYALTLACGGYVVVTGECGGDLGEGYDFGTVAYACSNGDELWERRYNNDPTDGDDLSRDIVSFGNAVYVTGRSQGSGTGWDYATVKYGCDGIQGWGGTARRYDYLHSDDQAWALCANAGGVYVTGQSSNGSNDDYATLWYALDTGNQVRVKRYDNGGADAGRAVAAFGTAVYVTGESSNGADFDFATVKYADPPFVRIVSPGQSIQAAIDAAAHCDIIALTDGTFSGLGNRDIDFKGKAITVRSQSGNAAACVIDCQAAGRGFIFQSCEGGQSAIENISIVNGFADNGGAIYCSGASPTLQGCVLTGNRAEHDGGALYCTGDSDTILTSCTVTANWATDHGGGGSARTGAHVELMHSILWGNCTEEGEASGDEWYCAGGTLRYCCSDVDRSGFAGSCGVFFCPAGQPSIDADPLFWDAASCTSAPTAAGDYHLAPVSPCAADPHCGRIGALGLLPTVGACCQNGDTCADGVIQADCAGPCDVWYQGTTCAQITCPSSWVTVCVDYGTTFNEGEPACGPGYVDTFNAGCDGTPPNSARSLPLPADGSFYCAASGTYQETAGDPNSVVGDVDWWKITIPDPQPVKVTLVVASEIALQVEFRRGVCTVPVICRADCNCDGAINFADINPFVACLSDPAGCCGFDNADVNADGAINFGDINPFVRELTAVQPCKHAVCPGQQTTIDFCAAPGEYYVRVQALGNAAPCGKKYVIGYVLDVDCTP